MTMVLADAQYGQRGGRGPMPGTYNSDHLSVLHGHVSVLHAFWPALSELPEDPR